MREYFIHDGQNEKGPLNIEQLKFEQLKKDTLIWYEGLEDWIAANEVEELKCLFAVKSTPPPLKRASEIPTPPNTKESKTAIKDIHSNGPRKKSTMIYILSGAIVVGSLIGWLVFENKTQAESLKIVQDQFNSQKEEQQQKEEVTQRKEQLQLLRQQQDQAEKERINQEVAEIYMGYRNNWKNFIAATNNQYTAFEFGGISNLAVIVYNRTDKTIDEVQVRVDYIKENGGLYKSETVAVTNIGPTSKKIVYAPTSDRGTSVKLEIESITAKSFHFCYPYGMNDNSNIDPYFCK
ncbi:MAG TPA: DUF4339 domain-containing protein [Phnomibacter sp.]|nr:DUF4339 domain-containing protein [Phnomibacter sp.]